MYRVILIIAITLTAALFDRTVSAGTRQSPPEQLSAASKEFAGTLKQLGDTLEKTPAKVEVSKWASIKAGAIEVQSKVAQLRSTIDAAEATAEELGVANGRLQARLDSMIAQYNRLADEAGAQAEQLSEPLASTVRRERAMWLNWAKVAEHFKEHYVQLLQRFEKQTADLKFVSPILRRLEQGAAETAELASIGQRLDQQVETLTTMADELNSVITAFGALANNTREALTQLSPRGSQQATGIAGDNSRLFRFRSPGDRVVVSRDTPYRMWLDALGRPLRARMIGIEGDKVKLQIESTGIVYDHPIKKLSEADQALVRSTRLLTTVASAY